MRGLLIFLTVAEALLLVGVLVYYLVRITRSLRGITSNLGKVAFGVRAIETQTKPVGSSVLRINDQLESVATSLDAVASAAGAPAPEESSA